MESPILTLGDVFSIGDTDYIFLATPADLPIVYAAKILTTEESRVLISIHDRVQTRPDFDHRSPVFCFVILESEHYDQRVAHFRDTELHNRANRPHERLSDTDIDRVKAEILEGSVPQLLKDLIRALDA